MAPESRKRGKTTGVAAFFSCADSAVWALYGLCRRHPPFPLYAVQSLKLC